MDIIYSITLDSCDATILKHLLVPNDGYVLLLEHSPNPYYKWWNKSLPILFDQEIENVEIRSPHYDVQLKCNDFIKNIELFKPSGINLFQLKNKAKDNLLPFSVPDKFRNRAMISHGMISNFTLPHQNEVAQFQCIIKEHIEAILLIPEIKNLVYDFKEIDIE